MMGVQRSTGQRSSYQQMSNNQLPTPLYGSRSIVDSLLSVGNLTSWSLFNITVRFCYTKGKP